MDTAQRRPSMADPLEFGAEEFSGAGIPPGRAPAVLPVNQDELTVNIFGGFVTAQKVAIKRNVGEVLRRMYELAGVMGMDYVYRIPYRSKVKDERGKDVIENGKPVWETVYVEGPTIVLANDLAREWGNCNVETRYFDRGTYWELYSRFVDLETGYTLTRPFNQRKGQDTGMKDAERRLDQVFQIGVSKAQRNVVVNVLQGLTAKIVDRAKRSVRAKIEEKPAEAKAWIMEQVKELAIDLKLIERAYGRAHANWTAADLAGIYMEIKSVQEKLATPDDIWGAPEEEPAGGQQPKQSPQSGAQAARKRFDVVDSNGELHGDSDGIVREAGVDREIKSGDPFQIGNELWVVDGIQQPLEEGARPKIVIKKQAVVPGGAGQPSGTALAQPSGQGQGKGEEKKPAGKKLFGDKK